MITLDTIDKKFVALHQIGAVAFESGTSGAVSNIETIQVEIYDGCAEQQIIVSDLTIDLIEYDFKDEPFSTIVTVSSLLSDCPSDPELTFTCISDSCPE